MVGRVFPLVIALASVAIAEPPQAKHGSSVITQMNAEQVAECVNLDRPGWQVHWQPDGKALAVLQFRKPVQMLSRTMFADNPEQSIGEQVIHFAFGPKPQLFAYNEGKQVNIHNGMRKVVIDGGRDQPKMTFSPDGKHIVTSCYGLEAKMWSVDDGKLLRTLKVKGTKGGLTTRFSPDGKILVVGNRNDRAHVFDADTGELLRVLDKRMSHRFDFSPDGKQLAVAYYDGSICIWEVASGTLLHELESGGREAFTVDWSPNGQMLATGGLNAPIALWSTKDFKVLHTLPAPERVFTVAFSPDGSLLASAGNTATQIWAVVE